MKTKFISILMIVTLGLLLFSCGTNQPQQTTVDVEAVRTEAVGTFASFLTATVAALPTISPTPTIEPTFTFTPTLEGEPSPTPTKNSCYKLMWIEDVTIPDGTVMKSNEAFTKTWLVQNTGGCAWAPGFTFNHVGGDSLRGGTVRLAKAIPVGLKYEISVEMAAPSGVYGVIKSSWQMAYESGMYFGDTLFVEIVIEDPNGQSVTPTSTP